MIHLMITESGPSWLTLHWYDQGSLVGSIHHGKRSGRSRPHDSPTQACSGGGCGDEALITLNYARQACRGGHPEWLTGLATQRRFHLQQADL